MCLKRVSKIFSLWGHLSPPRKTSKVNRAKLTLLRPAYSPVDALQRDNVHCALYCVSRGHEDSSNFEPRTVLELRGVILPQISHFVHFPIQNAWKVPSWARLTANGLDCRMLPVIPCSSKRSKWVPFARGFS